MANLTDTMICWNRGSGEVALVPWPDTRRVSREYDCSTGACETHIREADFDRRKGFAFMEAVNMIVGDSCDPVTVHNTLLDLEEYRSGLPEDLRKRGPF